MKGCGQTVHYPSETEGVLLTGLVTVMTLVQRFLIRDAGELDPVE